MSADTLILVDEFDREVGQASKESCHLRPGPLHRAFSVLVFDGPAMLVTQRSAGKRTWPLFWTNACCSHPRPGEATGAAAKRRLREELGIACEPRFLYKFRYQADYDAVVGEHELDWVFAAEYGGPLRPHPDEVADHRFVALPELERDVVREPGRYTPWFRMIVLEHGLRDRLAEAGR
jgi:isopentenyl-diphosphate delta-isomerase